MRANNVYLIKIDQLLKELYLHPSMSVYSDLVSQCNSLEFEANKAYISDKLSNIRIEGKMVATGRYEQGFSFESIKLHLLGDIHVIDDALYNSYAS